MAKSENVHNRECRSSPNHILFFSAVVSRGSGVPNPSLSAPGFSEVLLWQCVSLMPRGTNGCLKKIQVQVSKPELGCEQEVLRTDTVSGDGGLPVELEPPWWYRRVGWESSQAQETVGLLGTQCILYTVLG